VKSVYRMLAMGFMPLGALAGGLIAHESGLRAAYPIAEALRGIVLLAALPILITELRAISGHSDWLPFRIAWNTCKPVSGAVSVAIRPVTSKIPRRASLSCEEESVLSISGR
jgi:hypothetical protein